jgi:hypothetical protein
MMRPEAPHVNAPEEVLTDGRKFRKQIPNEVSGLELVNIFDDEEIWRLNFAAGPMMAPFFMLAIENRIRFE